MHFLFVSVCFFCACGLSSSAQNSGSPKRFDEVVEVDHTYGQPSSISLPLSRLTRPLKIRVKLLSRPTAKSPDEEMQTEQSIQLNSVVPAPAPTSWAQLSQKQQPKIQYLTHHPFPLKEIKLPQRDYKKPKISVTYLGANGKPKVKTGHYVVVVDQRQQQNQQIQPIPSQQPYQQQQQIQPLPQQRPYQQQQQQNQQIPPIPSQQPYQQQQQIQPLPQQQPYQQQQQQIQPVPQQIYPQQLNQQQQQIQNVPQPQQLYQPPIYNVPQQLYQQQLYQQGQQQQSLLPSPVAPPDSPLPDIPYDILSPQNLDQIIKESMNYASSITDTDTTTTATMPPPVESTTHSQRPQKPTLMMNLASSVVKTVASIPTNTDVLIHGMGNAYRRTVHALWDLRKSTVPEILFKLSRGDLGLPPSPSYKPEKPVDPFSDS